MKVKIIQDVYEYNDEKINDFIKDKKVIDIKYISNPYSELGGLHTSYTTVLIMYEEYDGIKLENCLKEFQNHCFFTYRRYQDHTISEAEFSKDCKEKFDEVYKRVKYLLEEDK